ncbi:MAG: hypothetical protein MJ101_03655 [Clostridia bacterium]|nr:hypothetical protein [Clostridia bacterium]
MLIIKPIQEKERQSALCALCGVTYDANSFAYYAEVDGADVGVCQFRISGTDCVITDIAAAPGTDDFEALFIMGRAVMDFCDRVGAHDAYICRNEDRLTKALGFKNKNGRLYMDMRGFFESPCKHEK